MLCIRIILYLCNINNDNNSKVSEFCRDNQKNNIPKKE
nr:MAG TPA: hypothetical protein [Caudoviricetes sp.]